jgi:Recombination endonuclease VII
MKSAERRRYERNWRRKNKVSNYKRQTTWRLKYPEKYRNNLYKHRYGISIEQYNALLEKQGGVCAICKLPPLPGKPLVVDHDHKCCSGSQACGKCVRGLLHKVCNTMLGMAKDNPVVLRLGAEYLENLITTRDNLDN